MRHIVRATLALSLLAACTQPPSQISLKGQNNYGKNGQVTSAAVKPYWQAPKYAGAYTTESYASVPAFSVPQDTVQSASLSSIGVNDLAPPTKTASAATSNINTGSVNQWTGKSRDNKSPAKSTKTVSQLEKAPASGGSHPNYGKPVNLIGHDKTSFIWPVSSRKVISAFGPKGRGKVNDGVNIASSEGEPVWAAADGEVVYVDNGLNGYGNMVLIKHADNKTTTYAHLSQATVDKYDRVKQGDIIGYVGTTGDVAKPQLHFAVRNGKNPVDPQKYVTSKMAGL